eukprot:TRINITY_DN47893_c0_g1_i1.p4 TRINITY_DN47893_c0_g1~~TRINITY_DN47893_c0_g1_i1.p4  ORF type:complete len:154 (-),score=4.16 TRINITY_DN47893_c0_g1_i1:172-633(-)
MRRQRIDRVSLRYPVPRAATDHFDCPSSDGSSKILILDEPGNGLDLFAKEQLLEDIQRIADEPGGPTMIYVSHHTEEILPCFKKLLLLKNGSIHKIGKTVDLLKEEVLNDFYEKPVQTIRMSKNRLAVFPKGRNQSHPQGKALSLGDGLFLNI